MSESMLDNVPAVENYDPNDAGRALRFVDEHCEDIRYVPAWKKWLTWCGHYWTLDESGAMTRLAVEHSRGLVIEANGIGEYRQRDAAVKSALQCGNTPKIQAMLTLAQADTRIVAMHSQIDANPWLLGVENGVIDLHDGSFRVGKRDDLMTKQAGTSYTVGAGCPRWELFMTEVFAGEGSLIRYLQTFLGYTLTGSTREHCLAFLYGSGSNGKSTFIETMQRLLKDYGQRAPQSLLTSTANGREPTNEIARLHGASLVVGSEVEEGSRLAEARVKDLTGGDTLTGRFLYAEAFDFAPQFKLWLAGNHKPEIRGGDDGIWRRMHLIPFNVQFDNERRDAGLLAKLVGELPGILNWALEGLKIWRSEGLVSPPIVAEAVEEYREEEDVLADFVTDEIEANPDGRVAKKLMFERYQTWATENQIRQPYSAKGLARRLRDRGYRDHRVATGRYWVGLAMKPVRTSFSAGASLL